MKVLALSLVSALIVSQSVYADGVNSANLNDMIDNPTVFNGMESAVSDNTFKCFKIIALSEAKAINLVKGQSNPFENMTVEWNSDFITVTISKDEFTFGNDNFTCEEREDGRNRLTTEYPFSTDILCDFYIPGCYEDKLVAPYAKKRTFW